MPKGSNPNSRANLAKGKKYQFNAETAAKAGRKGAPKSNASQAETRDLKREMQIALDTIIKNSSGEEMTVRRAIVLAQIKKAISGDSNAFKNCGEYADEKPAEKQEVSIKEPRRFEFVLKK